MLETTNLELDFENKKDSDFRARVCVVQACSYTKGVGAPTITEDCTSYREFEREIESLKIENLSVYIMQVFNTAGNRAIMIGIALGIASTSLKVILGVDRSWLGSGED